MERYLLKDALKCFTVWASIYLQFSIVYIMSCVVVIAGRWGTVCDDSWTYQNTLIVCRQLGYAGAVGSYYYEQGNETIWMDNVRCYGTEDQLQVIVVYAQS